MWREIPRSRNVGDGAAALRTDNCAVFPTHGVEWRTGTELVVVEGDRSETGRPRTDVVLLLTQLLLGITQLLLQACNPSGALSGSFGIICSFVPAAITSSRMKGIVGELEFFSCLGR